MDRCLDLLWPRWQPPAHDDGLIALATHAEATFGWAEAQLFKSDAGIVVWTSSGDEPERRALDIAARPGVVAMTTAPATADVRWTGVALEFATRLARHRVEPLPHWWPPTAYLTSMSPPAPPTGTVRVPHLVTLRRGQTLTDDVVWELAATAVARRWLGDRPDADLVEHHLPGLLRMRAAARAHRLPATAAAARLASLLGGSDLSIELVYARPELFRLLLSSSQPASSSDSGRLP